MAYTPEQRKAMYAEVSEKLADVVVLLRGFVDAEPELEDDAQPREEVQFAQSTASTLTNTVGQCKVREKGFDSILVRLKVPMSIQLQARL